MEAGSQIEVYRCQNADVRTALSALRSLHREPAISKADVEWYLKDSANHFYLAEENGEAIGCLICYELQHIDSRQKTMLCYGIAVAERHRRRGAGLALLDAAIGHCKKHRFLKMFVIADQKNDAAMGLYAKAGGTLAEGSGDALFHWFFEDC